MGLIGGIARTAVIAGTATAVSNNVSRRQSARWAARGEYPPQYSQSQYGAPEPVADEDDLTEKLDRLTAMKQRGQLTDDEYAAAKAKLLGL
jgi:hypothetical protein